MKHIVKLGLTLAIFAGAACFCLALVNHVTAPVIAQHQEEKANAGMKTVFPDADAFEKVTDFAPSTDAAITIDNMYLAKKDGDVIGAVAQVSGPTYERATILVGIDKERIITGVQFLALSDSPGFGLKASDPSFTVASGTTFYGQFAGKNANDGFVPGQTFDAISGATITSRSVGNLLSQGTFSAGEYLAEKYGGSASAGGAPVVAEKPALFTFEDALADILGDGFVTEDVLYDASIYPHNMIVDKKVVVKDTAGAVVAAAVAVSGQTYSEEGGTLVAVVDKARTILGMRIIRLHDTPNLGQNTALPSFYNQFAGKSADQDLRPDADYDVIAGASISSDCIADMVKVAAYEAAVALEAYGGAPSPAGSATYTLNEHYLVE
ncbi:MAG: FMN-binding protein [Treponema sp.]|nr:FMN-binding protein [Treponema sp.]